MAFMEIFCKPLLSHASATRLDTHTHTNQTPFCSQNNFDADLEVIIEEANPQKGLLSDGES